MDEDLIDKLILAKPEFSPSQALPSGTLTYLFTDIEGSVHLWDQYPQQAALAMKRHDELIEIAVEQQSGLLVRPRGEGDSRFAVFRRASDALRAAIAIQRMLSAEHWKIPSLRVRIGIHSGEAELREGDYYGNAVNRCARMRNAAHGGQILLSEASYCLLRDEQLDGVSLRDLGKYCLKGLERPEHIYQPVAVGLPSDFPPLITPAMVCNNLPLSLTSFIGREAELGELELLLRQSHLLTIAGPGGAGKTRLAVQLAQNVGGSFPDGVWFIDLAPLSNAALLRQYIMNILGMREEAGISPDQTLIDTLRGKTMLLIFDNCEHLMPEVAGLAEAMLRGIPGLRILATSREKLGTAGEFLWRIPPLSTPNRKETIAFENLLHFESVKLLQDRATAAKSDFAITRENIDAIVKICARLDGIPLAIELAAARVRVLSIEEIAARLDDRFHLLVGSPTTLHRHQTLRALIDWSYDLLHDQERILLRRLSVFAGSWTLNAAEQVCSDGQINASEVLDLLTSLIDKSFVISEAQHGHQRYRFLETILQFSHERLRESQEADELAQKHASYYLEVVETAHKKMWGPQQASCMACLDEEYDNLRAALGRLSNVPGCEVMLLQMASSLWRYWEIRGYISEGRAWLEAALAMNPSAPNRLRAEGLCGAGHLARQQADYPLAKTLHEQGLDIFRSIGYRLGIAHQLIALGEIAQHQGDYGRAVELHEEALSIWHETGDLEGTASSLRHLGVIARDRGQYQSAAELLEESLKLGRKQGDKLLIALSLNDLGLVAYHLCKYKKAVALFEEALRYQRELNDRVGISSSLQYLGNAAKDQGDFRRADQFYKECLSIKQSLGDKRGIAQSIAALAEIALLQGKYPLAGSLAGQSLALARTLGIKRVVLHSTIVLAYNALYQGNYKKASLFADVSLEMSTEMDAPQASGYTTALLALLKYAEGNLFEAREKLQEALSIFRKINDYRNIAHMYVNLARTAYRQGDHQAAMKYLDESLSISRGLNVGWTLGFVLEITGLLERHAGNFDHALALFLESLRLSSKQDNQQGIANCFGALAGLAILANQPVRAVRLFAAAAKLRQEMRGKMSSNDRLEYDKYLAMAHEHLDHATFEAEWVEGLTMTTEQIIQDLSAWSDRSDGTVSNINQYPPSAD